MAAVLRAGGRAAPPAPWSGSGGSALRPPTCPPRAGCRARPAGGSASRCAGRRTPAACSGAPGRATGRCSSMVLSICGGIEHRHRRPLVLVALDARRRGRPGAAPRAAAFSSFRFLTVCLRCQSALSHSAAVTSLYAGMRVQSGSTNGRFERVVEGLLRRGLRRACLERTSAHEHITSTHRSVVGRGVDSPPPRHPCSTIAGGTRCPMPHVRQFTGTLTSLASVLLPR